MKLLSAILVTLAFCVAAVAQTPQGYISLPNQTYTASFSMNGYSQTYTVTGSTASQQATLPPATTITALALPNATYCQTFVNGASVTWTVAPGSGGAIYSLGGTPSTITVQAGESATFWYIGGGNWATTAVIQQIESVMLAASLTVTGGWTFSGATTFNNSVSLNGSLQMGVQNITLNATPPTIAIGGTNASTVFISGSASSTTVQMPSLTTMNALPNSGNGATMTIIANATAAWTLGRATGDSTTTFNSGTSMGAAASTTNRPVQATCEYNSSTTNWTIFGNGFASGINLYIGALSVEANAFFSSGISAACSFQTTSWTTSTNIYAYSFTGSSPATVTLVSAPAAGQLYKISNKGTANLTVAPNTGQTLNLTVNTAGTLSVVSGNIVIPAGGVLYLGTDNGGSTAVWDAK